MARKILVLSIFLTSLLLVGCADDGAPAPTGPIVDRAQAEQDRKDADRRIQEANQRIALANARLAQQTADAQQFELSQRKAAASATAQAVALQATVNAQNALATSQARSAQQTASAIEAQQTRQAVSAAATATASAREIQQNLEHAAATATQQAVTLQIAKSEADAQRAASDAEFYNGLWRVVIVAVIGALLVFGLYAMNGFVSTALLRRAVIETRGGTMILFSQNGQPSAHALAAPALALPSGESDEFPSSDARTIDAEASTITVNSGGKSFLMAHPTEAENAADDAARRLCLKLLRASMQQVGASSKRIPTAIDLGWSSAQWQKAVDAMRDHLIVKRGRAGGVWINDQWGTVKGLWVAIGERRASVSTPPPQEMSLAAA